jgi:hypothetical protein
MFKPLEYLVINGSRKSVFPFEVTNIGMLKYKKTLNDEQRTDLYKMYLWVRGYAGKLFTF